MHLPKYLLALATLAMLSGCQAATPPSLAEMPPALSVDETARLKELETFSRKTRAVLYRNGYVTNVDRLSGSLALLITVDRNNRIIACGTERYATSSETYNPTLAKQMEGLCWISVLPEYPLQAFGTDTQLQFNAPLIFRFADQPTEAQQAHRKELVARHAQEVFFWEQALSTETLDSIGYATFQISANAGGKVQECLVVLDPHPLRPYAFKQDNALVERLTARCKQIDLRRMPGFALDESGTAGARVIVEYMPWRNGMVTVPKP